MADTVFDSYLKSVYGSGSGLEYFDAIHGGHDDIFGGTDPATLLDDIEDTSTEEEPSIIGYIQIGMHMTPIVSDDAPKTGAHESADLIAPMELPLQKKEEPVGPVEVGQMLIELGLA